MLIPSKNRLAIALCVLISSLYISCTNSGNGSAQSSDPADSLSQNEITLHEELLAERTDIDYDPNFLAQQLPTLASIVSREEAIYTPLNNYAYDVINPAQSVKAEKDLTRLFYKREAQIIPTLHGDILEPLALKNSDFFVGDAGRKLQTELQRIGMQCIYAEGMYVDLGAAEMLSGAMRQYGSEVLRYYAEFQSAHSTAIGGEYPFLDLNGEMRMVAVGEAMTTKYPQHEYTQQIYSDFEFALHSLTDIHVVIEQPSGTQEMFYALSTDPFPYMTDFAQHRQFVAQYPDTKYGKIVARILANRSEIARAGDSYKDLYLVVVQWQDANEDDETAYCDDAEALKDSLYLHQGIDVPHVLPIAQDGETRCAITHRFYPNRANAEKALKTLQAQSQISADIIKVSYNPESDEWEIPTINNTTNNTE